MFLGGLSRAVFVNGLRTFLVRRGDSLYSQFYFISIYRLVLHAAIANPVCQYKALLMERDVSVGFVYGRGYEVGSGSRVASRLVVHYFVLVFLGGLYNAKGDSLYSVFLCFVYYRAGAIVSGLRDFLVQVGSGVCDQFMAFQRYVVSRGFRLSRFNSHVTSIKSRLSCGGVVIKVWPFLSGQGGIFAIS